MHEQAPTTRFSDRVGDYVKFRPTYPTAAVDAVLKGTAHPERLTVADVGAGTGIFSRLLASRGLTVLAVEPNGSMAREIGPGISWIDGTAERTTLGDGSVDVVVCAQAFHWFKAAEALREFSRVLRPGGWVALVWNIRDESDALTSAYTRTIRDAIGSEPAEMRGFEERLLDTEGFARGGMAEVPHEQALDVSGFVGRATSASYVPKSGALHDRIVGELRAIHERHADSAGLVRMRYRTRVYIANRG